MDNTWNETNLTSATDVQRTTKEWAIANALSSIQARIQQDNQNRIAEYNTQFDGYAKNMLDHPELAIVPPVPAIAEVVVYNSDGWPETGPGIERVCPQKVYVAPKIFPSVGSLMQKLTDEGSVTTAASRFSSKVALFTEQVTADDGSIFVRIK